MSTQLFTPLIAMTMAAALFAQGEQPLRVDSLVQERKLLHGPWPVYPKVAVEARIGGTVKLEVLIGEGGTVNRIRLISGHPFLAPVAIAAVKHWEYIPTLRSGLPVAVLTTVNVHFRPLTDPPDQPGGKKPVVHVAQARD
jgi:protein TonB